MDLIQALSEAEDLPFEAVQAASRNPGRIATGVLRVLEAAAAGASLSEYEQNLLFWGVHVLAQARDTRLFRPLLTLLRRPYEEIDPLLGDAVTGTLARLAASLFDGDAAALLAAIGDRDADEFVRWNLFGALSFLTFEGRIARDETRAFLIRFDDERLARAGETAWNGWAETIALLGFEDLVPRVEAAWGEARLLDDVVDPDWFRGVLAVTLQRPSDPERFAMHQFGYFGSAIDELEELLRAPEDDEAEEGPGAPVHNPLRDVGRNDPCPCGSGKKFKKCCLDKLEDEPTVFVPSLPPLRGR
jgi:hypothetical protein